MNSDFTPHIWYNAFMEERGHIQDMTDNELLLAISNMMDKKLKAELQPIKEEIKDIKHHISNIELHIENITDKNIALLAENYVPAAKQYEKEVNKIEAVQSDVELLKKVVTEHSEKLQRLA